MGATALRAKVRTGSMIMDNTVAAMCDGTRNDMFRVKRVLKKTIRILVPGKNGDEERIEEFPIDLFEVEEEVKQ